jgi:hypothetical protein
VRIRSARDDVHPGHGQEIVVEVDPSGAAQVLQRLHEAQNWFYAGNDDSLLREILHQEVHWYIPGRNAIAGVYKGLDGVLQYMTVRRTIARATLRLQHLELLVGDGDHVASLTKGSAVLAGVEQTWSTLGLYRLRQGLIAECRLLPLDAEAFDRIWWIDS